MIAYTAIVTHGRTTLQFAVTAADLAEALGKVRKTAMGALKLQSLDSADISVRTKAMDAGAVPAEPEVLS